MKKKLILSYMASTVLGSAAIETLFTIGDDDGDHAPFRSEDSVITPAPGSPLLADDHYYVSSNEPTAHFERAFTSWDPATTVHFELSPEQANPDGIFTFTIDFIWSGKSGGGEAANIFTFRLNGTEFFVTPSFEQYQEFSAEVTALAGQVQAGPNRLEIVRSGGTSSTWIGVDYLRLIVDPTANQDADRDGLPLNWETLYLLSDNNPSDAAESADDDLLSNLEEYQAGTNPRDEDSDDDGLQDHLEVTTNALDPDSDDDGLLDGEETNSNPLLADTDGDGAFDAWEIETGYHPNDPSSTPPAFSGAIALNFRSQIDEARGLWSHRAPNGWVPQMNWNQTEPVRLWGVPNGTPLLTGNTSNIESPLPGTLVDAAGNALATTVTFTHDGCWTSANFGTRPAELLHGFLRSDETFRPTVTLTDIPYANYDLYLYLGAEYLAPTSTVRLNGHSATDQVLKVKATTPTRELIARYRTAATSPALYNTVRFEGLTGSSATVELIQGDDVSGIAAIQIVDTAADTDGDLLPDYWELQHRTDAGMSNADADPDGDLLDNAAEFVRGTDPNDPDSDDDGLSDFVESNSGVFLGAHDTGTDPLFGDTDGDRISDGDEVTNPLPSHPLLADTDGDGQDDLMEAEAHTDPSSADHNLIPVPTYPTDRSLLWRIEDVQLVQNHLTPTATQFRTERTLLSLSVTNAQQPGWRTLEVYLIEEHGRLGYFFAIRGPGGFNHPDGYDLFLGDKSVDYRQAMGLSGFGPCDISDPLTFEVSAVANPSPATHWTLNLRILNQRTSTTVASQVFTFAEAASSIVAQTATWRSQQGTLGRGSIYTGVGTRAFLTSTPLETLPAFSAHRDSDNDGIPDPWEVIHGLNPNNPLDAVLDPDQDNLSNRQEYYHGTLPNDSDSDDDEVNDDEEIARFTDASNARSQPAFFKNPLLYNPDLDGNALPDVWEAAFRAQNLVADGDPDGDGVTNTQEAEAGTNPLDALSFPFLTFSKSQGENLRLSWPDIPGKLQTLEGSGNLLDWSVVPGVTVSAGGLAWQEVPTSEREFFQVEFRNQNSDSDPLDDWTELALGLSPTDADSVARPAPFDSDNDGRGDAFTSGDLTSWQMTFANTQELRSGGPVTSPTSYDAARLLMQASFGPTMEDIGTVQEMGLEAWIDDQIQNQEATFHSTYLEEIYRDFDGPRVDTTYSFNEMDDFLNGGNYDTAFARAAISGPDQLRQRVAFALSQILVVSRRDANLANGLISISSYYDVLLEHSFGNYYDLLMEVTRHPTMGRYLSHIGNQPPAPEINRYPDENYARELMQLFTIGLWELEQNGTRKLDAGGNPIPTYSNEEITNFARVMTGFWFGGNLWGAGGWQDTDYAIPMEMHADYHDFDSKTLLNGTVIPKRPPSASNALLDVEDAVRNLFEHPNCAPFVSKALIQFLVTSNPTPGYIGRVSAVFANDGTGERGNLGAVIKAILMDPEARDPAVANSPEYGIFREPVIRTMHLGRLTRVNREQNLVWWDFGEYYQASFQQAMASPSVFNFYRPDYSAPGTLTANNLVGPALEITNSYSAVSFPNRLWEYANRGFSLYDIYSFPSDYSHFLPYASDHAALLDYVNLVVCSGHMNARTRSIILTALNNTDSGDDPGRVRLAVYLALMSPQGAVQR